MPVTAVIMAATDPVAGTTPAGPGPVRSGLVAMNREPLRIRFDAVVSASNE